MAKLTTETHGWVIDGYTAEKIGNLTPSGMFSSVAWEAWQFGRMLDQTGRTCRNPEKGRGSVWRSADGSFALRYHKGRGDGWSWERIA